MSEVLEKILSRRSIRNYKPDMIPKEIIEKIVTAGTYAPTAMNMQGPIIIAVTNKTLRDKLSKMNAALRGSDEDPFYGAPVVLVVLVEKGKGGDCDGSLVMGNLMLAAHGLGIGSCWIYGAKEEFAAEEGKELLKSIGIEGEYEGVAHCILGYVDGEYPEAAPRKENWVYYVE